MAIKNKVVIITGASSGIGKATALLLAESGAKVVLAARNQEKLEKVVNEIKERNGEAVYKVTDVSKREEVKSLVDFAISKYGKIDVIFNNAGLMPNSPLSEFRTELAERITNKAIKERIEFLYDTIGADPIIVAEAVKFAIDLPEEVSINEMTLYPTAQL